MKAHLTMYSQPEQLEKAMILEGMRHGDEALATIPNVRVEPAPGDFNREGRLFFCEIGPLQGVTKLGTGNGKMLPKEVELVGDFHVPASGHYNLHNVKLSSNGKLQVIQIPGETYFVPVDRDVVMVEEEAGG